MTEALILRTWPVQEADLIVSLLTRDQGRLKGIAKSGAKSRKRFGGALEPMTHVLAAYAEKPRQELVRLDSCEILASPLSAPIDYPRAAALAFYAEVLEETLPERDPQDAVFRLALAVLEHTRDGHIWLPVTYFALWMLRLMGWMPELSRCIVCGRSLAGQPAWYQPHADGLLCVDHRQLSSRALSAASLELAGRIFHTPIGSLADAPWQPTYAADLRRFALQSLERHLERRLRAAAALTKLSA
ncbi:DNA repair protein RecO [Silvibacterium sp.]|uniref:DNA repair protein RecO n=1 Tax=Silvibacterium sp. TaxID=1964179 RepID=UPI0039E51B2F